MDHISNPQTDITEILSHQKEAVRKEGLTSLATRLDRLDRLKRMIYQYREDFISAMNEDFTCRSESLSLMADLLPIIEGVRHAKKHLKKWMTPESRGTMPPLNLLGSRSEVIYQPLGVIGIMGAWNFPVNLTLAPLVGALAAGNRAILKPSELAPATASLLKKTIADFFSPAEVAVINGDAELARHFSEQPFDHLVFTGATSVAHHVMRAASLNLTPVTLELGGKSPVILSRSCDMKMMAKRVMYAKTLNAGQICIAPDYALVPAEKMDEFVTAAKDAVSEMYQNLKMNEDYTSIINQRHFDRLQGYLDEARAAGATVMEINPSGETFDDQNGFKISPHLVINPSADLSCMKDEIFGPILPVVPYERIEEVIKNINDRPRPLALYYLGQDKAEEKQVMEQTLSGGVSINELMLHALQEDLPFGGIGPSGTGAYHGHDGFRRFSHARSIYRHAPFDLVKLMRPPYTSVKKMLLNWQFGGGKNGK